ncbi:MAG: hypothetical protein PUJ93_07560, partial [Oscillospiraceae bacterium]|nr:hypothetical protein [Oscillospiraceae bacterium]MDY5735720.1 hypothetical protein [Oscillospiraceae bacterium]
GYTYLSTPPSNRSLALILCAFIDSSILPQPDLQYKGAFVTFRSQTSKYMISVRSFVDGYRRSENGCECYVSVPRCTEQSAGSSVCLRQLFRSSPKRTLPQRKTQSTARRFLPLAALHARFVSLPAGKTPPCGLRRGAGKITETLHRRGNNLYQAPVSYAMCTEQVKKILQKGKRSVIK